MEDKFVVESDYRNGVEYIIIKGPDFEMGAHEEVTIKKRRRKINGWRFFGPGHDGKGEFWFLDNYQARSNHDVNYAIDIVKGPTKIPPECYLKFNEKIRGL
jgi:hypothetical protein